MVFDMDLDKRIVAVPIGLVVEIDRFRREIIERTGDRYWQSR